MENEFLNGIIISYSRLLREVKILKGEIGDISRKIEFVKGKETMKTKRLIQKKKRSKREVDVKDVNKTKRPRRIKQKVKRVSVGRRNKHKVVDELETIKNYNFFKEIEEDV